MRLLILPALMLVSALACRTADDPPLAQPTPVDTPLAAGDVADSATAPGDLLGIEPSAVPELTPPPWGEPPVSTGLPAPMVSAVAAVVVDDASGEVLYAKDADVPLAPASLTKIATAIIAIEEGDLDAQVTVDVDSTRMGRSTVMGLVPGDRFTLRDLLYGMMLPSGNDASLAIAQHLAGTDALFVARMNDLAARLGLRDTHFMNPHGLGAQGHETSARDLAMLSRYAMTLPVFRAVVATPSWVARGSREIWLSNINSFLYMYAGADGLKTGFTRRAGPTIAASATRDGHRLFVVLLNDPARESDAAALLNWAFETHRWDGQGGTG